MKPLIWGKYVWMSLHLIALGYPINPTQEDKNAYKNFFNDFYKVIPCVDCAHHYKTNLNDVPLTDTVFSSRNNIFDWTIEIHNKVNVMLGKPVISKEHAYNIFTNQIIAQNDLISNSFKNLIFPSVISTSIARKICIFMNFIIIMMVLLYFFKKRYNY
jgi:hypothetical protein